MNQQTADTAEPSASGDQPKDETSENTEGTKKDEVEGDLAVDPLLIAGRVVDGDGRPASAATVRIRRVSMLGDVDTKMTADADGRFEARLRVKRETLPTLRVQAASADDSLLGFFRFPWNEDTTATDAIEIKLEPTKTANVKVVDAEGEPVTGANVAIQLDFPHTLSDATTDETGVTSVRLPESQRIQAVVAWKEGAGLDYRLYSLGRNQRADVNAKAPEFPASEQETLTLEGASPLTVRVVDDAQQPLAGIGLYPWLLKKDSEPDQLNLSYFASTFSQDTDATGSTTFNWLPAWHASPITIWANAEGFVHARAIYDPQTGTDLMLMQLDRLVPIRGRVVDVGGEPKPGITVSARGAGYTFDGGNASTSTDEDGRYELLVPPDQIYLIIVTDPVWASAPQDGFAVFKNQPVEGKDFTLRKPTRVFGTLTNEQTQEPIANQRVFVYQYGRDLHSMEGVELPNPENSRRYVQPLQAHNTTTDHKGRFELWLGDGEFDIRPPQQEKADKFAIAGEEEIELHVTTVVQKEVELAGVVTADDGKTPLAGARITGVPRSFRGADWQATTNADGEFRVKRFREPTFVHAQSSDGKSASIIEVGADEDTIALRLQPVGSATGRLLTSESEDPIGDAKIQYGVRVPDVNEKTWSYRFGRSVVTDASGAFRIDGLVAGWEYTLNLDTRSDGTIPRLTTVTVADEEDLALGDLPEPKPRQPYVPPTLKERIETAFSVDGTPLQRHERALELVDLVNQHLLVVFGDPDDPRVHRLMEIRYEDPDFRPFSDEFRFMAIPTDENRHDSALALAAALDEPLAGDRRDFLLVILDREGKKVAAANSRTLCNDKELSKDKLLELLGSHLTEPLDAKELLREALTRAAAEDKRVIVQETATWCGPCHLLSRYLDRHRMWEQDYIWIKMDHRWTGARELMAELRDGADGGVPWFAILDAQGQVLATSNDPETKRNIGYPSEESGQVHFANMLNATRQRLSEDEIKAFVGILADKEAER